MSKQGKANRYLVNIVLTNREVRERMREQGYSEKEAIADLVGEVLLGSLVRDKQQVTFTYEPYTGERQ